MLPFHLLFPSVPAELSPFESAQGGSHLMPAHPFNLTLAKEQMLFAPGGKTYQWPFLSSLVLTACGLPAEPPTLSQSIPSIGLLKTHKTASSTMASILNRVTDARQLQKMYPADLIHLGWPGAFPGPGQPPPSHQFDIISNHAVYNRAEMRKYLRSGTTSIFPTTLREPVERLISSFNWYKPPQFPDYNRLIHDLAWRKQSMNPFLTSGSPYFPGWYYIYNSMAYDLGWYHDSRFGDGHTHHDDDKNRIEKFLKELDEPVLITEDFDRSLILAGRAMGLSVVELTYHEFKTDAQKRFPSPENRDQLSAILSLDAAIYNHSVKRFHTKWQEAEARDPSLKKDLDTLTCLNKQLEKHCVLGSGTSCHEAYLCDSKAYTNLLKMQGGFVKSARQSTEVTRQKTPYEDDDGSWSGWMDASEYDDGSWHDWKGASNPGLTGAEARERASATREKAAEERKDAPL